MTAWIDAVLVLVLLLNLLLSVSGRISTLIRSFAAQAAAISLLAILLDGVNNIHAWIVALAIFAIKTAAIPFFLERALRRTEARREQGPLVSYGVSLVLSAAGVALAFALASRLPMEARRAGLLLASTAFSTMFTGLLLLVTRTKAISEVVGYLVLENGIFLFGLTLLRRMPLIVEMGILLDVFAGAFVMGIIIYNIHKTFDHIDVTALTSLKDGAEGEK